MVITLMGSAGRDKCCRKQDDVAVRLSVRGNPRGEEKLWVRRAYIYQGLAGDWRLIVGL
jgi:hypothetical protein